MQQRLTAAEARANAAEKRLKEVEASWQQTPSPTAAHQPEVPNDPDSYTQPMDNTEPTIGGQSGGGNGAPAGGSGPPTVANNP